MTTESGHRMLALVNSQVPFGVGVNALSHASLGMSSLLNSGDPPSPSVPISADFKVVSTSGQEIRDSRKKAISMGLAVVDFVETMTKDTYAEQLERTRATSEAELNYFCCLIAGPADSIEQLTE